MTYTQAINLIGYSDTKKLDKLHDGLCGASEGMPDENVELSHGNTKLLEAIHIIKKVKKLYN